VRPIQAAAATPPRQGHGEKQWPREIAAGPIAALRDGFLGGDIGELFGELCRGEILLRQEIDRSGYRPSSGPQWESA